jgi:hypothetical protein
MKLIPSSEAITITCLDFGSSAEYAKRRWLEMDGFSEAEACWEGTHLHFLTESIQPKISSPERPRVMLLFSNPHPESVRTGLFMSAKSSRGFWDILRNSKQLYINHDFRWDNTDSVRETVSLFLNGNYGGYGDPLLFFECLYPIPSKSPKDLKKLFAKADDFDRYLHRPSLERISAILTNHNIKVVLVFTGEIFESIVDKSGISKHSRQILCSAVKTGNESLFWECIHKHELIKQARLPDLKHKCAAIKVMDTRAKNWWPVGGRSIFSHVLDYALQYARKVG